MLTDIIASLSGLIIPQAFSFLKEKFIGNKLADPQKVLGDLALSKPEVIPQYMDAQARLVEAQIHLFNKDIVGTPAQWLIDLRGAIIPLAVAASLIMMIYDGLFAQVHVEDEIRQFFEFVISYWFGFNRTK